MSWVVSLSAKYHVEHPSASGTLVTGGWEDISQTRVEDPRVAEEVARQLTIIAVDDARGEGPGIPVSTRVNVEWDGNPITVPVDAFDPATLTVVVRPAEAVSEMPDPQLMFTVFGIYPDTGQVYATMVQAADNRAAFLQAAAQIDPDSEVVLYGAVPGDLQVATPADFGLADGQGDGASVENLR